MRTAILVFFGIAVLFFLLAIFATIIGKCKIDFGGYEVWGSEKWEEIYYKVFTPVSFISMVIGIILLAIYSFS